MTFYNNSNLQMTLTTTTLDLEDNNITTTGTMTATTYNGNLNSITGQLITLQGERNSSFGTSTYVFSMGDGSNSSTSFGYLFPCDVKFKKNCLC